MFSIKCIFYTENTAWRGLAIFHIFNSYGRLVISVLDRASLDGIENVGGEFLSWHDTVSSVDPISSETNANYF